MLVYLQCCRDETAARPFWGIPLLQFEMSRIGFSEGPQSLVDGDLGDQVGNHDGGLDGGFRLRGLADHEVGGLLDGEPLQGVLRLVLVTRDQH